MSASSYVGTLLPQHGVLAGAKLFIDGADVSPDALTPIPPKRIGYNGKGRPFYQGRMRYVARYTDMTLDEFQRLAVIFYPKLGSFEGTLVDVILPDIYQAGRFVQGTAYMEWPTVTDITTLINGVSVELTSFRLVGEV